MALLSCLFVNRSHVFAITNAKTGEVGQEVLSECNELRNLTPKKRLGAQLHNRLFFIVKGLKNLLRYFMNAVN